VLPAIGAIHPASGDLCEIASFFQATFSALIFDGGEQRLVSRPDKTKGTLRTAPNVSLEIAML
jgi:hypothetical protein